MGRKVKIECGKRIGSSEYFCTKEVGHSGQCVVKREFLNGIEQPRQSVLGGI